MEVYCEPTRSRQADLDPIDFPGPAWSRGVQYDLRRMMVFLDALTLNKSEIFIGGCAAKLDDKTGVLKDGRRASSSPSSWRPSPSLLGATGGSLSLAKPGS